MKILIACESSGTVRNAFRQKGHDAFSCDILPTESYPEYHYEQDIFEVIDLGWDMMIAHPPCTYLTVTGNKWMKPEYANRFPTRQQDRKDAIEFFTNLYEADIPKICVENPIGIMNSILRKPDQVIQPYMFGDPHAKRTCLWLKNLPKLIETDVVEPEYVVYASGKRMAKWYVDVANLPKHERMRARSKTFPGIAKAMADAWG